MTERFFARWSDDVKRWEIYDTMRHIGVPAFYADSKVNINEILYLLNRNIY